MEFKKQKPIYLQIADTLCERILEEHWTQEQRIPSVRDMAAQLGVNPNTVLRAFDHLQSAGIVYNQRGMGYYVAPDAKKLILQLQRREFLTDDLPDIVQKLTLLGITQDELRAAAAKLPPRTQPPAE